ncbi:MAG: hypothetical protein IH571_04155 [Acholeplasmataceae bacterium]|nr:hypothetical protein [Acholeplasmataceae bacterium]
MFRLFRIMAFQSKYRKLCKSLDIKKDLKKGKGVLDNINFAVDYSSHKGYIVWHMERDSGMTLEGFPEADLNIALFRLLNKDLFTIGVINEADQREALIESWSTSHQDPYDSRKYIFEYVLAKNKEAKSSLLDETIDRFTHSLNNESNKNIWSYDKKKNLFVEKKK